MLFFFFLKQKLTIFTFFLRKHPRLISIQSHLFLQLHNFIIPFRNFISQSNILLTSFFFLFLHHFVLANTVLPSQKSVNSSHGILLKEFLQFSPIFFTFIVFDQPYSFLLKWPVLLQMRILYFPLQFPLLLKRLSPSFIHIPQTQIDFQISLILLEQVILQINFIRLECRWNNNRSEIGILAMFVFASCILLK